MEILIIDHVDQEGKHLVDERGENLGIRTETYQAGPPTKVVPQAFYCRAHPLPLPKSSGALGCSGIKKRKLTADESILVNGTDQVIIQCDNVIVMDIENLLTGVMRVGVIRKAYLTIRLALQPQSMFTCKCIYKLFSKKADSAHSKDWFLVSKQADSTHQKD
ncbi:hypothetical protein F4604DRAFT_1675567 [Suillus subluteus]|nr:hypothetical protein F4604DRAFT_1675567 [Suillus subluteus]